MSISGRNAVPRRGDRQTRGWAAVFVAAALVVVMAMPAQALAQNANSDPTAAQYAKPALAVSNEGGGGGGAGGPSGGDGTLPFTGLDLVALAAVAVALTATGLALRRLETGGDVDS